MGGRGSLLESDDLDFKGASEKDPLLKRPQLTKRIKA
jgi:hypothetical protein